MYYFYPMNALYKALLPITAAAFLLAGCTQLGVFEKNASFKNHAWESSNHPSFTFTISDTTALYNLYVVIRHTDAYRFNNIWLKLSRQGPDTTYTQQLDLSLANTTQGWLGTGMDDIWEQRIPITEGAFRFRKSGNYTFTLEQIMRQDPLQHVLNAGIRVEKQP
ncbi:MAG: gliding motility lipoprotein GldH [Bacteroidota bacterium]|nr:gliding motility lipoprotein GldH [Bacteroidota bacterium]